MKKEGGGHLECSVRGLGKQAWLTNGDSEAQRNEMGFLHHKPNWDFSERFGYLATQARKQADGERTQVISFYQMAL